MTYCGFSFEACRTDPLRSVDEVISFVMTPVTLPASEFHDTWSPTRNLLPITVLLEERSVVSHDRLLGSGLLSWRGVDWMPAYRGMTGQLAETRHLRRAVCWPRWRPPRVCPGARRSARPRRRVSAQAAS